MNYSVLNYTLLFSAATLFVGVLTPLVRKIALRKGIFDQPNSTHKTHTEPIPYLGGAAIIIGVITLTFASTALIEPQSLTLVAGVLLPCLVLGLIGLLDDLFSLAPWPRLVAQTLVGIIVAILLIRADTVGNPTGSRSLDILLTILFIVGISNSINFFDNVDGGASGTIAISSIFLAFLAYTSDQFYIAAIATVLAGATIGFLKWNRSPARIYMGDAGSLFLGSLMASLLVRFEPNPISYPTFFFVPLFLIAVPLLDTSVAVLSRISRGVSPLQGGRDHLSHRLMRLGIPKVKSVIILWLTTAMFGALAVALSNVSYRLEPAVTVIGSLIWTSAFIYFFRIPATDELMTQEKQQSKEER